MPKVSIIVPIYNVENYLKECLDSIINQTFKDLEIILIDDGSKDSCPQIIDNYAKNDERIIVIHKKNGGLMSTKRKLSSLSRVPCRRSKGFSSMGRFMTRIVLWRNW